MHVTQQYVELSDTEETIALARIRVERLVDALTRTPIDRDTYSELAAFLEDTGWRACDAMDDLHAATPSAQAQRIVELLAGTEHDPRHPR